MAITNFKTITLDDMIEYIEANGNNTDKAEFKANAFVNGKYSHLVAVRYFCGKYFPDLLPVAKPKKAPVSDKLKNW